MLNVPGSNILSLALGVICTQQFNYYRHTGTTTNAIGFDVASYAAPVVCRGSVQAVGESVYRDYGLDWQKQHVQVWATKDIIENIRGRPADRIGWRGGVYDLIDHTDWFSQDGWNAVLAVRAGDE